MKYPLSKIFSLRPENLPDFETAPEEWADNPLSNYFAWVSLNFYGPFCSTPEHWTSKFTHYLFTSCPCCLILRGVAIGLIPSMLLLILILLIIIL